MGQACQTGGLPDIRVEMESEGLIMLWLFLLRIAPGIIIGSFLVCLLDTDEVQRLIYENEDLKAELAKLKGSENDG